MAIIAQTGAGKSYLTGRILECLIELGATAIVLDPNSDYVQLRKAARDAETPYVRAEHTPFADRVDIYRIPGLTHYRYSGDLIGPSLPFTVQFADLDPEDVLDSLLESTSTQSGWATAVRAALRILARIGTDYGPADLVRQLRRMGRDHADDDQNQGQVGIEGGDDMGQDDQLEPEVTSGQAPEPATDQVAAEDSEDDDTGVNPDDCRRAVPYLSHSSAIRSGVSTTSRPSTRPCGRITLRC